MTSDRSPMPDAGKSGLGYQELLRASNTGNRASSTSAFSSSSRLLLRCLQGKRAAGSAGPEVDTPTESADWTRAVDLADRHQVAALLYRHLEGAGEWAAIPAEDRERLRRAYYLNADRNIRRFHRLQPLLVRLRRAGIPVIALKGACLAEPVYANIALRPMSDADLLVPRARLAQARAVLLQAGWVHATGDVDTACRTDHQLGVFSKQGLAVEVHWTIERPVSPFDIDVSGLWDRARPARVADVEVLTLCPEDMLLHLCLHAAYHHGLAVGLLAFCDISAVIQRYRRELDWSQLVRSVREWGAARYAGLALVLARSLLAAEVPEDVLERLVPGGIDGGLLETARECVLTHTSCLQWSPRPLHEVFGAGSLADKLAVFWRRLYPTRASLAAMYSSFRGPGCRHSHRALWLQHVARSCWSYLLRPRLVRLKLLGRGHGQGVALEDWLSEEKG